MSGPFIQRIAYLGCTRIVAGSAGTGWLDAIGADVGDEAVRDALRRHHAAHHCRTATAEGLLDVLRERLGRALVDTTFDHWMVTDHGMTEAWAEAHPRGPARP